MKIFIYGLCFIYKNNFQNILNNLQIIKCWINNKHRNYINQEVINIIKKNLFLNVRKKNFLK